MKKLIPVLFFAMVALNSSAIMAASNDPVPTPKPTSENKLSESEVAKLSSRYDEINKMDKRNLSSTEKRDLRKESSQIKETLKADGTTIYVSSAAAIILIVILLLLIL